MTPAFPPPHGSVQGGSLGFLSIFVVLCGLLHLAGKPHFFIQFNIFFLLRCIVLSASPLRCERSFISILYRAFWLLLVLSLFFLVNFSVVSFFLA